MTGGGRNSAGTKDGGQTGHRGAIPVVKDSILCGTDAGTTANTRSGHHYGVRFCAGGEAGMAGIGAGGGPMGGYGTGAAPEREVSDGHL